MKRSLSYFGVLTLLLAGGMILPSGCESPDRSGTTGEPPASEATPSAPPKKAPDKTTTEPPTTEEDSQTTDVPSTPQTPDTEKREVKQEDDTATPAETTQADKGDATKMALPPENVSIEGINESFAERDLETWVESFEGKDREVYVRRKEVVKAVGLNEGDAIADIGAGTGFYSMLFAEEVGSSGQVYAVEVHEPFLKHIRARVQKAGHEHVSVVKGSQQSVNLPEDSIDVAFVCDAYHHFEHPGAMLASIRNALRPNGELFLIDFKLVEGETDEFVMKHVRADKETFTAEIEAAGFKKAEEHDFLENNYAIRFVMR